MKNDSEIAATFGNQIRVRVYGILISQEEILLVNHSGLNESGDWWAPPGGGLIFEESMEEKEKHQSLHHISQASDLLDKNGYFPYISKMNK